MSLTDVVITTSSTTSAVEGCAGFGHPWVGLTGWMGASTIGNACDRVDVAAIVRDGRDADARQTCGCEHPDCCVCVGFEGTAVAAQPGPDPGRVAHAHRVADELGMMHRSINPADFDTPPRSAPSLVVQGTNAVPITVDTTLTVTPDALPHLDLARQRISHGEEDIILLQDPAAPTTVTFTLTTRGDTFAPTTDGGAVVLDPHHQPIAVIAAPWTHDATNTPLTTTYTITPTTLTQTITTTPTTTYPVTADPKITWGIITGTIYFNKEETAFIAAGSSFVFALAKDLPSPWNFVLMAVAGFVGARAAAALSVGKCLAIKSDLYVYDYRGSYCK
jgi:hypothetical protein